MTNDVNVRVGGVIRSVVKRYLALLQHSDWIILYFIQKLVLNDRFN